jgi:hypothetical protein
VFYSNNCLPKYQRAESSIHQPQFPWFTNLISGILYAGPTVTNLPPALQGIALRPTSAHVKVRLAHTIPSCELATLRHALTAGERFATVAVALDKVVGPVNEVAVGARDQVARRAGDDVVGGNGIGVGEGSGRGQGGEEEGEEVAGELHVV